MEHWTSFRPSPGSWRDDLWGVRQKYGIWGPLLQATQVLYKRSKGLVQIAGCKSDSSPVVLHQITVTKLFITILDRIYRCSRGAERFWFSDLRIASLNFVNDVVLLASSSRDLQLLVGQFTAGMRISISKSRMVSPGWDRGSTSSVGV